MDTKLEIESEEKPAKSKVPVSVWIKTCTLILVWACMGMSHVMLPTTLPDMRDRLGVDTEEMSRGLAIGSVGSFLGSLLGGLADRYNKAVDLILAAGIFVAGLMLLARGFITTLWIFTLNLFIDGIGWTCVNAVGNSVMMDLWGEKGGPPMHALHVGYPIGAMIGPLIAYPFVSTEVNSTDHSNLSTDVIPSTASGSSGFEDNSSIEIAYSIVACLDIVVAGVFVIFHLLLPSCKMISHQDKGDLGWKTVLSPSQWAGGDFRFGMTMLVFMMTFYILHVITIKGSSTYYMTYAVDSELGYTNQQATLYSSITNFAATLGRGLSIVFANCVPIQVMFLVEVSGQSVCAFLTLIWGLDGQLEFLIFNCAFFFFRDPIWPSGYTFTDRYISLYAVVVGLIDIAAKVADMTFTWILGYLYEYSVMESLFYTTAVASVVLCGHLVLVTVYAMRHGHRFNSETTEKIFPDVMETTKL